MILQERNECGWGQVSAGLAASSAFAKTGRLPLIVESIPQAALQVLHRAIGVVSVVAIVFTRDGNVQRMMDVVIPLRVIKAWSATGCPFEVARAIVIVFKHQVNLPPLIDPTPDGLRQFDQYVPGRVIDERMHGVEAQSVEVKFTQPIECVVNEELAYRPAVRAVEIQRFPPRRPVTVGKELRGILVQIVPL